MGHLVINVDKDSSDLVIKYLKDTGVLWEIIEAS